MALGRVDRNEAEGIFDVFSQLSEELESHASWHKKKQELYNGDREAPTLDISISKEQDRKLPAKSDWGQIAVDYVVDRIDFDVIENDNFGLNSTLQEANVDSVLESATKQALIGACSFVSVTPGNEEIGEPPIVLTVYAGSEATGIYDSRTNSLSAGLSIESYKDGKPYIYRIYLRDGVYEVEQDEDDVYVVKVAEGTGFVNLVPFVFKQDLASKPFGESRLSSASTDNFDRALRIMKRMELTSEHYAHPMRYIAQRLSNIDSDLDISEKDEQKLEQIGQWLQYEGSGVDEVEIGQFNASSPDALITFLNAVATQYANSMFMEVSDFTQEPSGGSVSSETIIERKRKMEDLVEKTRNSFSQSILLICRIALTIQETEFSREEFRALSVRWLNNVAITDYVGIGDAVSKIQEVAPVLRDNDYALDMLGISKRNLINSENYQRQQQAQRARQQVQQQRIDKEKLAEDIENSLKDPRNTPGESL